MGNLARNPELGTTGDATFARFCLVGKDEIEEGEQTGRRHVTTSLWFFAFGDIALTIARHAGFKFGARRGGYGSPTTSRPGVPDKPLPAAAEVAMEVAD